MPVLMIQFIKGKWKTGEREAAKAFGGLFEIHAMGEGVYLGHQGRGARQSGRRGEGWEFMIAKVAGGGYRMLILDEINCVLSYEYLPVDEVLRFLREKPRGLHVVLTGAQRPARAHRDGRSRDRNAGHQAPVQRGPRRPAGD